MESGREGEREKMRKRKSVFMRVFDKQGWKERETERDGERSRQSERERERTGESE